MQAAAATLSAVRIVALFLNNENVLFEDLPARSCVTCTTGMYPYPSAKSATIRPTAIKATSKLTHPRNVRDARRQDNKILCATAPHLHAIALHLCAITCNLCATAPHLHAIARHLSAITCHLCATAHHLHAIARHLCAIACK